MNAERTGEVDEHDRDPPYPSSAHHEGAAEANSWLWQVFVGVMG
jgi:hypothetical protein